VFFTATLLVSITRTNKLSPSTSAVLVSRGVAASNIICMLDVGHGNESRAGRRSKEEEKQIMEGTLYPQ
jgi:hypothetical protein